MNKFIDFNIVKIIEGYRDKGYLICLATAAPSEYAQQFAELQGFDFCLSTETWHTDMNSWKENIRKEKYESVKRLFTENKLELSVVMTDHYDDVLLIENAVERVYVVRADKKLRTYLKGKDGIELL